MVVLVTGAAGFIGSHTCQRLLARGDQVVGLDNLNDYYDVSLKEARLCRLTAHPNFRFVKADLADSPAMAALFNDCRPQQVVHLAAQAGVRYSLENPELYVQSNIVGFLPILEGCRRQGVEHLVFASSSSVYGANAKVPFSVADSVDHPLSLYAATKKSNELMAHTYSHLYDLPVTGLRFFTVYGPWGRPDMAAFLFTRAILDERPISVFNHGKMQRDFTYIDDITEGILQVLDRPPSCTLSPTDDARSSHAPYRIYNIGNQQPVELGHFIGVLEDCLGKKACRNLLPLQPGDVLTTFADVDDLVRDTGFTPKTSIEEGLARFVGWYRAFYRV